MIVTDYTRARLKRMRFEREMATRGFEEVGEGGGNLWKLHRGAWYDRVIVEVLIDPCGKSLWVRTAKSVE